MVSPSLSPSFRRLSAFPKRIVVKIGSSLLAREGRIHRPSVRRYVEFLTALRARSEVALVTSGAVASADLEVGPGDALAAKQARAAVGQVHLMEMYRREFARSDLRVGQLLLAETLLKHRLSWLNARNTLMTLFRYGVVPIINENDPVAVEELKFGDNDALGAIVSALVDADLYVILSDVEGLFTDFGTASARLVEEVNKIDASVEREAGGSGSTVGTGGMASKLRAAKIAGRYGVPTLIASGRSPDLLQRVGIDMRGTLFHPERRTVKGPRAWMASALHLGGRLVVDGGAEAALTKKRSSLLPSGVTAVEGRFHAGDLVAVVNEEGREIARGLVNYSSYEVQRIRGKKTHQIAETLGHAAHDEIIHRDHLLTSS